MSVRPRPSLSRPLQTNDVDQVIRRYGGSTVALEMEEGSMKEGKQIQSDEQNVEFLVRKNGALRAEVTFYRACYQGSEQFMHEVTSVTQDLLDQCIVGLLDNAAWGEIRELVESLYKSAETYRRQRQKALSQYIFLYKQNSFALHIESESLV